MIVIVMGVTGSGKTTVGRLFAEQMGWHFADADDFHPAANIEKMSRGVPLDDADRQPWLSALRRVIDAWAAQGQNAVLACSALKQGYRRMLTTPEVRFAYLKTDAKLAAERVRARHGHFAGEAILAGQFADLEEPRDAIVLDAQHNPAELVRELRAALALT